MWIGHRKEIRKLMQLTNQLIKPNYLVIFPTDAASQFLIEPYPLYSSVMFYIMLVVKKRQN